MHMKQTRNDSKRGRLRAAVCAAVMLLTAVPLSGFQSLTVSAEDVYAVRDPFYQFSSGYNYYTSEHFQFIWGNSGNASQVTTAFLEGNAANLETCWEIYTTKLGMLEPCESTNLSLRDGTQYKTNIYISGTGLSGMEDDFAYMSYDSEGFAYMFCDVTAMAYDPASWVLPHEFGHVVTAHQLGWNNNKYSYAWWEALGNWFREEWLYETGNTEGYGTDFFETYLKNLCLTFPCGRDFYAAWPFLIYLTENPDQLEGYGAGFVATMLQQGQVDEYPLTMIDRLAAADMKDTLGHYAKRLATLDFAHQSSYCSRMDQLLAQGDWNWQQIYTMVEPADTRENWYSIPTERAPQQAGVNLIPLNATNGTVTVTLNGLTDVAGADWRACVVREDAQGNTYYSDLFSDGESVTVDCSDGASALYITVVATPDTDTYVECGIPYYTDEFSETNYPFSGKTRYPYELKIEGTTPMERAFNATAYGSYHSNGGGFVAATASVASTAYVGPDAMVLGYATVSDNAVITDHAVVEGSAKVSGNAVISGYGMVCENATVSGNALVSDYGLVMGTASISGNAKVIESALVYDSYQLTDNAIAKGMAFCLVSGSASGQGIVDGDYYDDGNKTATQGTSYGWFGQQSYVSSRPYTDGLYVSYDFDSDSSTIAQDRYTSTYGVVHGAQWEASRTSANGVLTFDGASQYVALDRSLQYMTDTEIQFAALWKGGANDQKLFWFGDDSQYLYFTPCSSDGKAEFVISDGQTTEKLTADALNQGEWYTVRILLNGDTGTLMLNGQTVASAAVTLDPCDVVGDISITSDHVNLLGCGYGEDYFKGSLDFFSVYFQAATEPTYYYTATEEPDDLTASGNLYGDANVDGEVKMTDIVLLTKVLNDSATLTEQGKINANVILTAGDEAVTASDVSKILTYISGQIVYEALIPA